jgi:hypothetical protein
MEKMNGMDEGLFAVDRVPCAGVSDPDVTIPQ